MKYLFLAAIILFSIGANAQVGLFKPKPIPSQVLKASATAAATEITQTFIRPVVGVGASTSSGTQLVGGFGLSVQNNRFDTPSNSWAIRYGGAILGFLGTDGTKTTASVGVVVLIPGTNGIIGVGPLRDFTNGAWGFISSVNINL